MKQQRLHSRLDAIDARIADWMERWGHFLHRVSLGMLFAWFGLLKVFGYKSATSLIAQAVYLGPTEVTTAALGVWEAAIGACLIVRPLVRVALLLLAVRLPGTLLALALKADVCFDQAWAPTIVGQYLIKDALLFSAAMVIGGTVREEKQPGTLR